MATDFTEDDWNLHKAAIRTLYITEKRPLKGPNGVIQEMSMIHGFNATKAQYERRFKKWGFQRNKKSADWKIIAFKVTKRKREMKETEVRIDGDIIPTKKLKELSRYGYEIAFPHHFQGDRYPSAPSPKTPEGVLVCTPPAPPDLSYMHIEPPWLKFHHTLESLVGTDMDLGYMSAPALGRIPLKLTNSKFAIPSDPTRGDEAKLRAIIPISAVEGDSSRFGDFLPSHLQYFSLMMYFISNNMMSISDELLTLLEDRKNKSLLLALLRMRTPITKVFIQKLFKCALRSRRTTIVKMLESDLFLDSWGQNSGITVVVAIQCGYMSLAKRLIAAGADMQTSWGKRAFQDATIKGDTELVELLIEAGVAVNSQATGVADTAIQEAARAGNIELARLLIAAGADVNAHSIGYSATALQEAAQAGNIELARLLIEAGADVNAHSIWPFPNALQEAVQAGNIELAKLLIEAGADINARATLFSSTAIQVAARFGNISLVKLLIDAGADINAQSTGASATALKEATRLGNIELVKLLIDAGADVNTHPIGASATALQEAIRSGNIELVKLLIGAGADVNARATGTSATAIQEASRLGNTDLVELLIEEGADTNVTGSGYSEEPALITAARDNDVRLVRILLGAGARSNVTASQTSHRTPLFEAVCNGNAVLTQLLLDAGADANFPARRPAASTPLFAAVWYGNVYLVRLLLDSGADADAGTYSSTPLFDAVCRSSTTNVWLLLKAGANVNAETSSSTPLLKAVCNGNVELVRLLLDGGAPIDKSKKYFLGSRSCWYEGTAIHRAIQISNYPLVQLLLDAGADVNVLARCWKFDEPECYETTLQIAAHNPSSEIIRLLIVTNPTIMADSGAYALYAAVNIGDIELFRFLLDVGADVNTKPPDQSSGTILQEMVRKGNRQHAALALDAGANVNSPGFGACSTALQEAANIDDITMVRLLLCAGADVNTPATGPYGRTALQLAVWNGSVDLTELLLNSGAAVNAPGSTNYGNALLLAAQKGDLRLVNLLLFAGAEIDPPLSSNCLLKTPLQAAAKVGCLAIVTRLLEGGAEINAGSKDWRGTALQAAAKKGHVNVIKHLLRHGADTNAVSGTYGTALQQAVDRIDLESVCLLLNYHANPNIPTPGKAVKRNHPISPLQSAVEKGSIELVKLLVGAGADVNLTGDYNLLSSYNYDWYKGTVLLGAVAQGSEQMVRLLLSAEADPNVPARVRRLWNGDEDYQLLPLQMAIIISDIKISRLLLNAGANASIDSQFPYGFSKGFKDIESSGSLLVVAVQKSNAELVHLLIDAGAKVNLPAIGYFGRTALQAATEIGDIDLVELLVKSGAEINALPSPKNGATALQLAAIHGYARIASILLKEGADPNAAAAKEGGRTALEGAAEHGRVDLVQMLLNAHEALGKPVQDFVRVWRLAFDEGHLVVADMIRAKIDDESSALLNGLILS